MTHKPSSTNNTAHVLFCFGFLFFTRKHIRAFLAHESNQLVFVKSASEAINKGFNSTSGILAWGKRGEQQAKQLSEQFNCSVWTVEDGFIRSTGLGSDFSRPASLVIDKQGIYYDPQSPSDLETLLQSHEFSDDEINQGLQVQQLLVELSISKYNVGISIDNELYLSLKSKQVILIPGQVEDDASIQKGCVDIHNNSDLIKAVRQASPDAFLVYKPHPDVISGNRMGKVDEGITSQYCDAVFEDVSITDCLEIADEVHTLTSLVGMEALMRGCKVVCYGLPFYAGWGLTDDKISIPRRSRKISLHELIAATYIIYPRYIDWQTGNFTSAQSIIKKIQQQIEAEGGKQVTKVGKIQRFLRKARHIMRSLAGV